MMLYIALSQLLIRLYISWHNKYHFRNRAFCETPFFFREEESADMAGINNNKIITQISRFTDDALVILYSVIY